MSTLACTIETQQHAGTQHIPRRTGLPHRSSLSTQQHRNCQRGRRPPSPCNIQCSRPLPQLMCNGARQVCMRDRLKCFIAAVLSATAVRHVLAAGPDGQVALLGPRMAGPHEPNARAPRRPRVSGPAPKGRANKPPMEEERVVAFVKETRRDRTTTKCEWP